MKNEDEIQSMRDRASMQGMSGSKFAGMSYEDGVKAALEWVLGDCTDEELSID